MSQPVLIKVYGNIWPANACLFQQLEQVTQSALPTPPELDCDDELLKISFEGIYFPVDELLEVLEDNASSPLQGKVDVLDIENWVLNRYFIENGRIGRHSAPLNNVLDYSGH